MSEHAIVIGAGFGGLAAAARLRAMGHRVTVLEAGDQPGGRARAFEREGFHFDAGPTVITAPYLFDELFELFGKDRKDYFEASEAFGRILRNAVADTVEVKMRSASDVIASALEQVDGGDGDAHLRERLEHLDAFRERASQLWDNPLLQRFLR